MVGSDRSRLHQLVGNVDKRVGVYCGVDATAGSLHVGHLVPFMALFWMYLYGHTAISLVCSCNTRDAYTTHTKAHNM